MKFEITKKTKYNIKIHKITSVIFWILFTTTTCSSQTGQDNNDTRSIEKSLIIENLISDENQDIDPITSSNNLTTKLKDPTNKNSYDLENITTISASVKPMVASGGTSTLDTEEYVYSLTLKSNGTVWAWGSNVYGQLGNGSTSKTVINPMQIKNLNNINYIVAGHAHSLALKSDGTVWAWGWNYYGQLGDGTYDDRTTPIQIKNLTGVVSIAAGYGHSLALKSDGTVWAWGVNGWGQLGNGNAGAPVNVPTKSIMKNVIAISSGYDFSEALKSDGTVWGWGDNHFCQVTYQIGCGEILNSYQYFDEPVQVVDKYGDPLTNIVAIDAGGYHTLAIKKGSVPTVYAWGNNSYGQICNGYYGASYDHAELTKLTNIKYISAGNDYSLAVKSDGTIWSCGNNGEGQLGIGKISEFEANPVQVMNLTNASGVSAGNVHSLGVKSDGSIWGWGDNFYGELGDGTTLSRTTPVKTLLPNIAPTGADTNFTCTKNTSCTITLYAVDTDSPQVCFTVTTQPKNGTAKMNGSNCDDPNPSYYYYAGVNMTYTPKTNFTGTDYIYFQASDGYSTDTTPNYVKITVQ